MGLEQVHVTLIVDVLVLEAHVTVGHLRIEHPQEHVEEVVRIPVALGLPNSGDSSERASDSSVTVVELGPGPDPPDYLKNSAENLKNAGENLKNPAATAAAA